MKQKRKNILLIAGMLLVLLVGILVYGVYTQEQIYQESTENLLSTYGQSAKTFTMFAQRNWNILNDWESYLSALVEKGEQDGRTFTRVVQLDRAQRQQELARLTGGASISATMLESAGELLDQADKFKKTLA